MYSILNFEYSEINLVETYHGNSTRISLYNKLKIVMGKLNLKNLNIVFNSIFN